MVSESSFKWESNMTMNHSFFELKNLFPQPFENLITLHFASIVAWCIIVFGYIAFSTFLQFYFYNASKDKKSLRWKIQANHTEEVGRTEWWLPILKQKKEFASLQPIYSSINLILAASFLATTVELTCRNKSRVYWEYRENVLFETLFGFCISFLWQSVLVYYWHRLMHIPFFYIRFHKYHHYVKTPNPFDDFFIHPLEAFGYYCLFYSPFFIFDQPISSMILYVFFLGVTGVFDHSGVNFIIPWVYSSIDHDYHHLKTNVNFGFPCIFMDVLHGTYYHNSKTKN